MDALEQDAQNECIRTMGVGHLDAKREDVRTRTCSKNRTSSHLSADVWDKACSKTGQDTENMILEKRVLPEAP